MAVNMIRSNTSEKTLTLKGGSGDDYLEGIGSYWEIYGGSGDDTLEASGLISKGKLFRRSCNSSWRSRQRLH